MEKYLGYIITGLITAISTAVTIAVAYGRKSERLDTTGQTTSDFRRKLDEIEKEKAENKTTDRLHLKIEANERRITELSDSMRGYIQREEYTTLSMEQSARAHNFYDTMSGRLDVLEKRMESYLDQMATDRVKIVEALSDIREKLGRMDERICSK